MSRITEPGWVQIGVMCNAGRRSVWTRDVWVETFDGPFLVAIELCSGREGGDWYKRVTPSHPEWEAVREIVSMLTWIVETNADEDERDEARLPLQVSTTVKVKGDVVNKTAISFERPWTKHGALEIYFNG